MEFKDYYEVLGCKPNATPDELKRAYRELAGKFHPDLASPRLKEWSEKQMKLLNEAYDVLGDPRRRAQYDQARANGSYRASVGPDPAASYSTLLAIPVVRSLLITLGITVAAGLILRMLPYFFLNPKGIGATIIILGIVIGAAWMRRGNH